MTVTRPRAERGAFPPGTEHYGRSLLGAPLIWFPAPAASQQNRPFSQPAAKVV